MSVNWKEGESFLKYRSDTGSLEEARGSLQGTGEGVSAVTPPPAPPQRECEDKFGSK